MKNRLLKFLFVTFVVSLFPLPIQAAEVVVISGIDEIVAWLEEEDWWGEVQQDRQLQVPKILITEISPRWQEISRDQPVSVKKGIFYRLILPLVVHANTMVLDRRERLEKISGHLASGARLSQDDLQWLATIVKPLRISTGHGWQESSTSLREIVDKALYKLDIVPAGLALGQAAYESGYGTSRFAAQGNALFGQWTFGGEGIVPEQQREHLGDHRIASYRWPFDSLRAYVMNLNSHPAYEEFRRIRSQLREEGKPLSSLAMADGLTSYSERGQAYIDTLKGIIRVNKLDRADGAVFRDEPMKFVVGAATQKEADDLRRQIDGLRKTGELARIITDMSLE
jgi:Bax protein